MVATKRFCITMFLIMAFAALVSAFGAPIQLGLIPGEQEMQSLEEARTPEVQWLPATESAEREMRVKGIPARTSPEGAILFPFVPGVAIEWDEVEEAQSMDWVANKPHTFVYLTQEAANRVQAFSSTHLRQRFATVLGNRIVTSQVLEVPIASQVGLGVLLRELREQGYKGKEVERFPMPPDPPRESGFLLGLGLIGIALSLAAVACAVTGLLYKPRTTPRLEENALASVVVAIVGLAGLYHLALSAGVGIVVGISFLNMHILGMRMLLTDSAGGISSGLVLVYGLFYLLLGAALLFGRRRAAHLLIRARHSTTPGSPEE